MRRLNKAGLSQRLFAFFILGFAWLVFIYYLILLIFKEGYFGGEALLGGGFLLLFIAVMTFLAYPTVGDWNVYEQENSLLLKRYWKKVYLNKEILSIKSFALITFLTGSYKLDTNKGTYFIRHHFPPEGFFINPEEGKRDLYRILEPYLASYNHVGRRKSDRQMTTSTEKRKKIYWLPFSVGILWFFLRGVVFQPDPEQGSPIYMLALQIVLVRYLAAAWVWRLSRLQRRNPIGNVILALFFPAIMLAVQGGKGDSGNEEHPQPFRNEDTFFLIKVLWAALALVFVNWLISLFFFPIPSGSENIQHRHVYWGVYYLGSFPFLSVVLGLLFGSIPYRSRPYAARIVRMAVYSFASLNVLNLIFLGLAYLDALPF